MEPNPRGMSNSLLLRFLLALPLPCSYLPVSGIRGFQTDIFRIVGWVTALALAQGEKVCWVEQGFWSSLK